MEFIPCEFVGGPKDGELMVVSDKQFRLQGMLALHCFDAVAFRHRTLWYQMDGDIGAGGDQRARLRHIGITDSEHEPPEAT
jgi:hypothetical protein